MRNCGGSFSPMMQYLKGTLVDNSLPCLELSIIVLDFSSLYNSMANSINSSTVANTFVPVL